VSWTPNDNRDTVGYDLFLEVSPVPEGGTLGCSSPPLSAPYGSIVTDSGFTGMTVPDPNVGTFLFGAVSGQQAAVALTAVDALGNEGPATAPACAAADATEADPSDEAKAPGLACAVSEAGAPPAAAGAAPVLGLLAVAWGMTRLSRRRARPGRASEPR
jgi:hypothetical protein